MRNAWPRGGRPQQTVLCSSVPGVKDTLTTRPPVRVRSVERAVCPVCVGRLWTASLGLHADATIFSNRLTTIAMGEVGPL